MKHSEKLWEIALRRETEGYPVYVTEQYPVEEPMTPDQLDEIPDAELNVEPLRKLLLSDILISPYIRKWLAGLLDPDGDTGVILTLKDRPNEEQVSRPARTHLKENMKRRHAALYAMKKQKEYGDKKMKRGIKEAAELYNLSESIIYHEISHLKEREEFKVMLQQKFRGTATLAQKSK